jgi:hypothetical protein
MLKVVPERLVDDFEALTDTYRRMDYREGSPNVQADVVSHLRRMLEVGNRADSRRTDIACCGLSGMRPSSPAGWPSMARTMR